MNTTQLFVTGIASGKRLKGIEKNNTHGKNETPKTRAKAAMRNHVTRTLHSYWEQYLKDLEALKRHFQNSQFWTAVAAVETELKACNSIEKFCALADSDLPPFPLVAKLRIAVVNRTRLVRNQLEIELKRLG